jgi:lysophospholipase L1-like esterase
MTSPSLGTPAGARARRVARPLSAAFAVAFALASTVVGPSAAHADEQGWVGSWMASPQQVWEPDFALPTKIPATLEHQTVRQFVRLSIGGSRLRLVFSNAYGDRPLRIGGASVGLVLENGATTASGIRRISFGGKDEIVVPPGAPAVSDPLEMKVEAGARLAVSMYLPDETPLTTFHWDGRQTAWFGDGNLTSVKVLTGTATTDARIFLSGVLVDARNDGAIVVVGDSITDGNGATVDADARWPDFLARRLAPRGIAVLNGGISGGRLLEDKMGVNVAARLKRDVLSQPGLEAIILLIGINDISWPGTAFAPDHQPPTIEEMIAGYQQVIALARTNNVRIVGATLPPFKGALSGTPLDNYYHPDKDRLRQEINRWIRESGAFDAVVDLDAVLRDPQDPARLLPAFDSGDHLHPGDAGNRAMAEAIDLGALLGR